MIYFLLKRVTHMSRSTYLLVSLVCLIFVYPVLSNYGVAKLILGILFAVTPLTGVYAVSGQKKTVVVATVLAVPAMVAIIGHFFLDAHVVSDEVFLSFVVAYYVFTTAAIIGHIFSKRVVDADTIISAVAAYLMIGLSFAVSFVLVEFYSAGALIESTADHVVGWHDIFYYSFVTLTTLGYGDVAPVSPLARSLASLEAVCGVIYMSVMIARLVSEYQASRTT
jgi:hypothetical protein